MDRLYVADHKLCWRERGYCSDSGLLVDTLELPLLPPDTPGVTRASTPYRIDMVCVTKQGRVVGVESKKVRDLVSSHTSRRLARQLGVLRQVVDVPCLLLRGFDPVALEYELDSAESRNLRYRRANLYRDLIRYQNSGVTLLLTPDDDSAILAQLSHLRGVLGFGRSVGAFCGTDKKRKKET